MCIKYVLVLFLSRKMFFLTDSKGLVLYFYNQNKNLYNNFDILKN